MKTILIPITTLLLVACNAPVKNNENMEPDEGVRPVAIESVEETTPVTEDSAGVDAVTSATAMANHSSFNGKMIVPPQRHATVTLTMGGTVHTTSLLPGDYVKKGTVLVTLEIRTLFSCSKRIWMRMHRRNIWQPNTIARNG